MNKLAHTTAILLQCINEYKLSGNDSSPLEVHSSPVIVVDVVDL